MKKRTPLLLLLSTSFIIISCGGAESETAQSEDQEINKLIQEQEFLCRCLNEPGNSDFSRENKDACRNAISQAIGVENWEKVNMRDNPEISARFDELAQMCNSGNPEQEQEATAENTEITTEPVTENLTSASSGLMDKITSDNGFVWETVNNDADIYTVLTFNGTEFRNVAYNMNGSKNPKNFTRVIEFSGTWEAKGDKKAIGSFTETDTKVEWTFNDDYTMLINSKGVQYRKVSIN